MVVRPTEILQQASEQQQSRATRVLVLPLSVQARPVGLVARECSNLIRPLPLLVKQEPELEQELEQELAPWPGLLGRTASLAFADYVQGRVRLGQIESQEKPTPQLKWERIAVPGSKAPRRE
jgi:hypothetical protein